MPNRSEHLHAINIDGPQSLEDEQTVVTGYGLKGEVDPETDECLAKMAIGERSGRQTFFLKRATEGPDKGSLYNPQSPFWTRDAYRRGCYRWRAAKQEQFDLYVAFLKTSNPSYYRNAERVH